jgi:hypothetical protein
MPTPGPDLRVSELASQLFLFCSVPKLSCSALDWTNAAPCAEFYGLRTIPMRGGCTGAATP